MSEYNILRKRRFKSRKKASIPREGKGAARQQGSSGKAAVKARSRVNYENKSLTLPLGPHIVVYVQSFTIGGKNKRRMASRGYKVQKR